MIRRIIQYARSCSCQHKWELVREVNYFRGQNDMPCKTILFYRCVKCGYVQKVKM